MIDYGFSYSIIKNKSIKVYGVAYYEDTEVEEVIGIFTFDKVIYKHRLGEFLAIKKPGKSKVWRDYRFKENVVKLVYLNILEDNGLIWCWLLTENWGKEEIEGLEQREKEIQEVLERFRERMRIYKTEFFGGERVESYVWQQLLRFEKVERMNAPSALVVSYCEPIRRYFKPLPLIIDIGG